MGSISKPSEKEEEGLKSKIPATWKFISKSFYSTSQVDWKNLTRRTKNWNMNRIATFFVMNVICARHHLDQSNTIWPNTCVFIANQKSFKCIEYSKRFTLESHPRSHLVNACCSTVTPMFKVSSRIWITKSSQKC